MMSCKRKAIMMPMGAMVNPRWSRSRLITITELWREHAFKSPSIHLPLSYYVSCFSFERKSIPAGLFMVRQCRYRGDLAFSWGRHNQYDDHVANITFKIHGTVHHFHELLYIFKIRQRWTPGNAAWCPCASQIRKRPLISVCYSH